MSILDILGPDERLILDTVRDSVDKDVKPVARELEHADAIWKHQSIGNLLADMATKLTAARQLTLHAVREADAGRRADMEAGMAKLCASETAMEIALNAVRVHGGYGYSTEFDVERYFRDAPLMIVGEGTNEIQRNVIVSQLVSRGGLDA
ncbi:acyl-CoA dehydrogenase family protein [Saccharopolyspora sp. NFXS83]|nr:acyl-CoA dehydrogenase family protein [Saccharopolyspora sp. NFXS83]MCX2734244.1 acyl-CoA dehydrogenase family protein [Saccharopolyspora sp. NFXS83]